MDKSREYANFRGYKKGRIVQHYKDYDLQYNFACAGYKDSFQGAQLQFVLRRTPERNFIELFIDGKNVGVIYSDMPYYNELLANKVESVHIKNRQSINPDGSYDNHIQIFYKLK